MVQVLLSAFYRHTIAVTIRVHALMLNAAESEPGIFWLCALRV